MLRSFDGVAPQVADSAYVDETAVIIGDVVIEADASVWPNVTIRGDHGQIVVAEQANVQDNAVVHEATVLRPSVTVGHGAIVHAATVDERALVGMNAVLLDDAHVGKEAVVAAGSVVTEGTDVPDGMLVAGTPAEPRDEIDAPEFRNAGAYYAELADRHSETAERID